MAWTIKHPTPHYVRLDPGGALPAPPGRPFRAVVLVREPVGDLWRQAASRWLVEAGCLCMLAWGDDCSKWDDDVDWANIDAFDSEPIPPECHVVTTWHEHESLAEVFEFARCWAKHPKVALSETWILDISGADHEPAVRSIWAAALT